MLERLVIVGGTVQVMVRTSEGTETRDSYVEKRTSTAMIRNQSNSSVTAAATASNLTVPGPTAARSYWTTQSNNALSGEQEARRTSTTTTPKQSTLPPIVMQAVIGVNFIADHLKQQDEFNKVHLLMAIGYIAVTSSMLLISRKYLNDS